MHVQKIQANNVLDLGCGDGAWINILKKSGRNVIGVDISIKSLHIAKNASDLLICSDAHFLPFESNSFDAIIMIEVIEHLSNPILALKEVHRVLTNGGRLILTTPNGLWEYFRGENQKHISLQNLFSLRRLVAKFFHELRIYGVFLVFKEKPSCLRYKLSNLLSTFPILKLFAFGFILEACK